LLVAHHPDTAAGSSNPLLWPRQRMIFRRSSPVTGGPDFESLSRDLTILATGTCQRPCQRSGPGWAIRQRLKYDSWGGLPRRGRSARSEPCPNVESLSNRSRRSARAVEYGGHVRRWQGGVSIRARSSTTCATLYPAERAGPSRSFRRNLCPFPVGPTHCGIDGLIPNGCCIFSHNQQGERRLRAYPRINVSAVQAADESVADRPIAPRHLS